MKITVKPRVVSGTGKGGEDLFLDFEATGAPSDTFTVDPVDGDPSWDCEGDGDEDDPANVWSCRTDAYEFQWKGTLADLHKLAIEAGVADVAEWEWSGNADLDAVQRFQYQHFVAGNAD